METITEPMDVWFIWTKTGRKPQHVHYTEAAALVEAERLIGFPPLTVTLGEDGKVHLAVSA